MCFTNLTLIEKVNIITINDANPTINHSPGHCPDETVLPFILRWG